MRFNNRFCALMDIPDLPAGAFEHIGDNKIKPQGGGNPVSFITDPISSALGTDGGGGGLIGAVEDVGQSIGSGLASIDPGPALGSGLAEVDKFVGREIPGGWVTPALIAAAAATGYVDPSLLAGEAAFTGATETGLATLAGEGIAAETVGAALLSEAAAAEAISQALPYTEAFDAFNLAQQGLGSTQIAQNLTATGLDSFLAQDMAQLAVQGLSPEAITQALSYSYTPTELAGTGIKSNAATLPSKGFTASEAVRGARLAQGLLGRQPQFQPRQQLQIGGAVTNPYGAVDYSGLLNLLSPRMAQRNPNSLLG
jgi:hypothetical protein